MKEINKYYVYVYLDPRKSGKYVYEDLSFNYEPFYIGKGSNKQMYSHLKENVKNTNNLYKYNKIQKIIKETANNPIVVLVKNNISETEAFELEKHYINLIGRSVKKEGPLTNIIEGGSAPPKFYDLPLQKQEEIRQKFSNKKYSKETIEKRVKKATGKKRTKEFCENLSKNRMGDKNPMFGNKQSKKSRKKKSNALINNKFTSKPVIQLDLDGKFIKEWPSTSEAGRQLGVGVKNHIYLVCNGKRKTAYGFKWKYQ